MESHRTLYINSLENRGKFSLRKLKMDVLVQELDAKLRQWQPEGAEQVRQRLVELIELADQNPLDVLRSRTVEQEVLDLIDESEPK
jgi:hypothetical protein